MEKVKLSLGILLLFVLLSITLSVGALFVYEKSFPYVFGTSLISSVILVVLFFFLAHEKKEVQG